MKKGKEKQNFKLAAEINRKMILMYLGIYIFILLMLCALLIPRLYKSSDSFMTHTLGIAVDEFMSAQKNVSGYTTALYTDLPQLLKDYEANPTDAGFAQIELALTRFVGNQANLLAASLEDFQHHFFRSNYYHNIVNQENALKDEEYQKIFSGEKNSCYAFYPGDVFLATAGSQDYSHHTLSYSQLQYYNQVPYVITLYYELNAVMRHCETLFDDTFTSFAIYSPQEGILYSSPDEQRLDFRDISVADLFDYRKSSGQKSGSNGHIYYDKDTYANWIYLAYSPNILFYQDAIVIIGIITALYLFSPVLYTLLLYPIVNHSLAPLNKLYKTMVHYSPASLPQPLEIQTNNEIAELCTVFNQMTVKISQQLQDIQNKEHVNAITNYKLLATQIDPHFIYNTMNIINILARQGKDEEIIQVNSALIKILRERLNCKLSIVDTLDKELDSLYQYQIIMNYRYQNHILIAVHADDSLLEKNVPKNILQPLVENSFYHGFPNQKEQENGMIEILIYPQGDNMVIELSDNGIGMEEERLRIIRERSYQIYNDKKPHIGLDNIRQRLDYVYGDHYQFDILSSPGCGTTISITIPVENAK